MQTLVDRIQAFRDAIRRAVPVGFTSSTHDRKFCPQVLGTKLGEWHCLGWQYDGETSPGRKLPDWRCIELHDIETDIMVLDEPWQSGWTKGRQAQTCVDVIDTVVDRLHAAELRSTFPARTLGRARGRVVLKTRR